jgi:hypothetical protein
MALHSSGTGSDKLAAGTTAQRPTLIASDVGSIRFNTDISAFENWNGTAWVATDAGGFLKLDASNGPVTGSLTFTQNLSVSGTAFIGNGINLNNNAASIQPAGTATFSGLVTGTSGFAGNLTSTTITNSNGDVQLNTGNGENGQVYIARPLTQRLGGDNSLVVGASSNNLPFAVLGRELGQTEIFGYPSANFLYGGAFEAALNVCSANGGNNNNWKTNIAFSNLAQTVPSRIAEFQTRVGNSGFKLYLEGAVNGFEVVPKSTAGSNQSVCMSFYKRTSTDQDIAGQIKAGGQGSAAFIRITSTDGSAPATLTITDTRNVTSSVALPDPTTAIKALTPELLTLSSGKVVASFPATHTRTKIAPMVYGVDNGLDEDGADELVGVDHANLVPYLTKALQALIARVETLEAAP